MTFDVVIAGGGPAGCALAIALARRGIASCVIERGDYRGVRAAEILPSAAAGLVESLGINLTSYRRAFGIATAWTSDTAARDGALFGSPADGWVVERARFDTALAAAARDHGVTVLTNSSVDPLSIDCRWRVDATGRSATLARQLGAKRLAFDHLAGIFAAFESASDQDGYVLVEAAEHGWWYSAHVPPGHVALAFMSDTGVIRANNFSTERRWMEALRESRHTNARINGARIEFPLHVRSSASHILDRIAGHDWLAIGDAASAWDPLSCAGMYKALRNAFDAAEAIAGGSTDAYEESVRASFDDYLVARDAAYAQVRRWPESPFWRQRGAASDAPPRPAAAGVDRREAYREHAETPIIPA